MSADDPKPLPASADLIREIWQRWGGFIVSLARHHHPENVEGLYVPGPDGALGLVTWVVDGDEAEIVTLDAFERGKGLGKLLLFEAERRCAARGAREVWLLTTNDNVNGLGFYLHCGYRLVRVHLDAMDEVRRAKPQLGPTNADGVPMRDLWELRKPLEV